VFVGITLLALALTGAAAFAASEAAIDFSLPVNEATWGNFCLGFEFTTKSDVTVTHLGFYDNLKDGLTESHAVGLFDASGRLLVSGAVKPGDPLEGWFRHTSVVTATLPAGRTFVIASVTGSEQYTWQPGKNTAGQVKK